MADVQLLTLIDFIQSTVERLAAAEQLLGPRSVELLDLGGTNGAAGDVPRGSAPGCVGEGGASRGPVPLVPGPGGPRDSGHSQPSNTIRVIELEPASAPNADDRPV
jgi:hypothetical protein